MVALRLACCAASFKHRRCEQYPPRRHRISVEQAKDKAHAPGAIFFSFRAAVVCAESMDLMIEISAVFCVFSFFNACQRPAGKLLVQLVQLVAGRRTEPETCHRKHLQTMGCCIPLFIPAIASASKGRTDRPICLQPGLIWFVLCYLTLRRIQRQQYMDTYALLIRRQCQPCLVGSQ